MKDYSKEENLYWLWLMSLTETGSETKHLLLTHFGSPERIYCAEKQEYQSIEGLRKSTIDYLLSQKSLKMAGKSAEYMMRHHIEMITWDDSNYPLKLREIYHPPVGFFAKGNLNLLDQPFIIGVVGSRKASPGGIHQAEKLSGDLGEAGITIISGLAKGIDAAAHKSALKTVGSTIAVLGCGINVCYPADHKPLFKEITGEGGLIISEYYLDEMPLVFHFPLRNRIISGISDGVLVVESARKSGALITAKHAMEQGKNVYAVPKDISMIQGIGNNNLLKDGAKLVTSARDILEDFIYLPKDKDIPKAVRTSDDSALNKEERMIAEWIARGYDTIDSLELVTGIEIGELNALLSMMELKEVLSVTYGKIQLHRLYEK